MIIGVAQYISQMAKVFGRAFKRCQSEEQKTGVTITINQFCELEEKANAKFDRNKFWDKINKETAK